MLQRFGMMPSGEREVMHPVPAGVEEMNLILLEMLQLMSESHRYRATLVDRAKYEQRFRVLEARILELEIGSAR